MLNAERQGLVDVFFPLFQCLAWKGEHQVDTDVGNAGLTEVLDSLDGLLGVMPAMEKVQTLVVESLNTHAHPVDGKGGEHLGE